MTDTFSIALAQLNPCVGDISGNGARILDAREKAIKLEADVVIFSELTVTGYPPEDLILRSSFMDHVEAEVEKIAAATADGGPALIIGAPMRHEGGLYNAAILIEDGEVKTHRFKHDLPNYNVFDEKRIFSAGSYPGPMMVRGVRLGVMICEDMWSSHVGECLVESGAEILAVLNGSPFEIGKGGVRMQHARDRVAETELPLVYVNQVGGQDELVFDGGSFVLNADGTSMLEAPYWREDVTLSCWRRKGDTWVCDEGEKVPDGRGVPAVYSALMLGLRDYVEKNGFPGIILGLSGGIDSALSAAVAVDALGPERVHCVMMPSPYTSQISLEDARAVAKKLGVRLDEISISPAMEAYAGMLESALESHEADTTEENIQARSRAMTLMAISNRYGYMVLSTGNKSEMSVGYATLYGDMCGGYSVLKDVYKSFVFTLARWRNEHHPYGALGPEGGGEGGEAVMPERVITKPPSAELKADQKDTDSLPPYDVLDAILECLVEKDMGIAATVAEGFDQETVARVWKMLINAEYKRRQAPPGVKVSSRAFGKDRRYPITNYFKNP